MSGPTPGPWEVREGGFGRHAHVRDAMGGLVADDVFPEANARLIAAAPDLYEACNSLLAWAEIRGFQGAPMERVIEGAKSAVKKAEGR